MNCAWIDIHCFILHPWLISLTIVSQRKYTDPWVLRHPPSSWQNRYVRNRKRFDELLEAYLTDPTDTDRLCVFPPADQLVLQADKRIALQWMAKKEHLMHPTNLTHPIDDDRDYLKPVEEDMGRSGTLGQ